MRIQETDEILKESRYSRQPVAPRGNIFTRAWRSLLGLFGMK